MEEAHWRRAPAALGGVAGEKYKDPSRRRQRDGNHRPHLYHSGKIYDEDKVPFNLHPCQNNNNKKNTFKFSYTLALVKNDGAPFPSVFFLFFSSPDFLIK